MPPLRFYAINLAAVLLWAPAHVLPGVFAVSVLRELGMGHYHGIARHTWIPGVIIVAVIAGVATWWWQRRRRQLAATEPARNGA
jgi:membrane-associated protein